ncbi:MAG: flavodoxin domain-containing protein [Bacteroidales bacterium]|nr:flavodoxin domain-containing protein [Bacteroidales bacterium]
MKTAILFASSHGTTKMLAELIAQKLKNTTVDLINLKKIKTPQLAEYNTIIIGCSIHAGNIKSVVKKVFENNLVLLRSKNIALFLCCMNEHQKEAQFNNVFPEWLRKTSICNITPGGEFLFEEMNFIEKAIVRKVSKIDSTVSQIDYAEIDKLVEVINKNSCA